MNHFWTHKDKIPQGYGYGQFTLAHFLWIALTFAGTLLVVILYGNANHADRLIVLRTIAATLILIDAIKMFVIAITGIKVLDYLPLEVCSFAAYFIVCDSIWPGNSVLPQMLLTLFLPAAIMAILFPTTTTLPSFNFFTIHQFLYHGLLMAYIFARFFASEIPLTSAGVWRSIFIMCPLVAFMYLFDVKFDKNYMFLRDTYGNAMLETIRNKSENNIGYQAGLVCFSIMSVHVFYLFFKLLEILL